MPRGVYTRTSEHLARLREVQRLTHLGATRSATTKAKISASTRGKIKPKEWRDRMSGDGNGRYSHGMTRTPTWQTWVAMRTRCTNPNQENWPNYGGRGITVCARWDSFENFLADMGERPEGMTLDRIDVDGNYEPDNCRWATPEEQAANKRRSR